jgi:hypothetical protein
MTANQQNRQKVRTYWRDRLVTEPLEDVARSYGKKYQKGYAFALEFMRKLKGSIATPSTTRGRPLVDVFADEDRRAEKLTRQQGFATGQQGLTGSGKRLKIVKILPGKDSRSCRVYADVEGVGLVEFDQNGIAVDGSDSISTLCQQAEDSGFRSPPPGCVAPAAPVAVGVITETLTMTPEELRMVKAFLGSIRLHG